MSSSPADNPRPGTPEAFWSEAETLGRAIAGHLEYLDGLGAPGLPRPARAARAEGPGPYYAAAAQPPVSKPTPDLSKAEGPGPYYAEAAQPPASKPTPDLSRAEGPGPYHAAANQTATAKPAPLGEAGCQNCPRGQGRTGGPPPGRGSGRPLLALVGAEPNFYDNNGPEAELLAAILTKGLKLPPDHVYLTALLKCPPQPNESQADRAEAASACLAETRRELARLAPKIVLALGEAAGAGLTGRDGEPLGLLRTRTFTRPDLPGAWLRVTFGLDQMLEAPEIKRAAWRDDFLKIKKFLDKPPCPTTAD